MRDGDVNEINCQRHQRESRCKDGQSGVFE